MAPDTFEMMKVAALNGLVLIVAGFLLKWLASGIKPPIHSRKFWHWMVYVPVWAAGWAGWILGWGLCGGVVICMASL